MQLSITHFVFMAVGVLVGGLMVWPILKGKLARADADARALAEDERRLLAEQLKAASHEIASLNARLAATEDRAQRIQSDLDQTSRDRAQLSKRPEMP